MTTLVLSLYRNTRHRRALRSVSQLRSFALAATKSPSSSKPTTSRSRIGGKTYLYIYICIYIYIYRSIDVYIPRR